ncbi:hypothetical protein D3C80_820310 [compost metagenome]
MDALIAFGDDGADAQQAGALGRPVARRAGAVFLAGEDDQGTAFRLVAHGRVIDRHGVARREVLGDAALDVRGDLVADADVGEGAAHHDFVVAAAGAVAVEVQGVDAVVGQIDAGGRGLLDRTGRADVVGGDRVAEDAQDAGLDDVADRGRLHRQTLEVGRVLDVGRRVFPLIGLAAGDLDGLPVLVALEDVLVALGEHGRGDRLLLDVGDLLRGRPDVLQEDVLALLVLTDRLLGDVDAHRTGDGVGHDQRRRGQVVGLDVRVHAAFEVAVARQDRGRDQAVVVDRLRDGRVQRARVADAGGAAVADQVEAHGVQILLEAGVGQIVGDDLRAGGQRGLDPGLDLQTQGVSLARHQTGGDQDRRVGGVGARGDGGDDHVAVAHGELLAFDGGALGVGRTTEDLGQGGLERGGGDGQFNAVLRTLGTGQRRHDRRDVQLQNVGEDRVFRGFVDPQALGLGVGFDQGDARLVAAGGRQIVDGRARHREEAAGGAVFRGHVGDGGLILDGHPGDGVAEEFHELADHALLAQHLGDGQHQVGGGRAFRQLAGQLEADDFRDQHGDRLTQHGGLGLDAAYAPAQDGQAVDHGGVAVGAYDGVGIGDGLLAFVQGPDGLGQVLQVDLVADAGAGRHDAEVVEGRRAPAQEVVALDVALILALDVLAEGLGVAEVVDHDRVVDDQVDGDQRIDLLGVGAQLVHGVAHGGQVDHGGNAGEVLHQDAGRTEGDLVLDGALVLDPGGDGLQVVFRDRDAVFVAQQVLEKHLHRARQTGNPGQTGFLGGGKAVIGVFLAPDRKVLTGLEAVNRRHGE